MMVKGDIMNYSEREKQLDILHKQTYNIVKSNDLIQKSRFDLTISEQKILLRLIQMIQPQDERFKEYEFDIQEFCDICGIDRLSGGNYAYIKSVIDRLKKKHFYMYTNEDKTESSTVDWISKARINKSSGIVKIRLDDDLMPYLLNLKQNFTSYSFYNVLAMRSKYSPRLYEIFKSEQYKRCFNYDLAALKKLLNAENYELYGNFKQKVLDVAIKEINEGTDIYVEYEPIKVKRKYIAIRFNIKEKTTEENFNVLKKKRLEQLD